MQIHIRASGEGNDNVGKELISRPRNAGASTYMRLRSSSVSIPSFKGTSLFCSVCLKILVFPSPIIFFSVGFHHNLASLYARGNLDSRSIGC
jgi:hypothetical protein